MKLTNYISTFLFLLCALTAAAAESTARPPTRGTASNSRDWKPVPYRALAPTNGVTLDDAGLFKQAMVNNITYLLDSFSVNHMLVPFRLRAGQKDPPDDRPQIAFWDLDLRGSNAGRFLMGAGNTLRWIEHQELRQRLNELIDGIEACREPNGYILAYPPDKVRSEEPNYGRAWFTHGLIEAAIAGNPKAYRLLRGHADWFNQWDMLPKLIYHSSNSHQGHIASTRTYFTPVGKPEDLQIAEKHYVADWWMNQLAARQEEAVWKYPLQNPHSYLITSFEAYLDHYLATGQREFLDSMLGAWDLIHDQWEHVGGSMAICEGNPKYPPSSYYIKPKGHTGETCGSVFWIKFCQRFHQLYPSQEKYVSEIEKSIYNVCLANQGEAKGIRYHALLEGRKEEPKSSNTCCEGQGTRFYGSLPEHIFSTAEDGLYVNLYEPSTIRWQLAGQPVSLTMKSKFPLEPQVELRVAAAQPITMKLRVRVPGWALQAMPIRVNGEQVAVGHPGSYEVLDRRWSDGDTIAFTLPMDFRLTRYSGSDQIEGHERYALEYGPILLAAVGPLDKKVGVQIVQYPQALRTWLKPKSEQPLHFAVEGQSEFEFMPYWQITDQTFTCFPIIEPIAVKGSTTFLKSTQVEIVSKMPEAKVHYTLDGSEPTAQSPAYAGSFELKETTTVKARAFAQKEAKWTTAASTFNKVPLLPPAIGLKRGTNLIEMVMPALFPEAGIHYTLDGREPTADSARYTAPFATPPSKTTILARAILPNQAVSTVVSFVADAGSAHPWPTPDIHISDLTPLKATVGWNTLKPNKNIAGKPLVLAGKQYEKGMGVHAESELIYPLKPEYRRFVALVGIDDDTQSKGSVSFEVYVDEQIAYQTPVMRAHQTWHINVPIPAGAQKVRLVLTDGGDDYNYDWGDWVEAGFKFQPRGR